MVPHGGKKKAPGKANPGASNSKKEKGNKQTNAVVENANRNARVTKKSKGPRKTNENGASNNHSPPPSQKEKDKTIFDLLFSGGSDEVVAPSPAPQPSLPPQTKSPDSEEFVYVAILSP